MSDEFTRVEEDRGPPEEDAEYCAWRARAVKALPGIRAASILPLDDLLTWVLNAAAGGVLGNAVFDWSKRSRLMRGWVRYDKKAQERKLVTAASIAINDALIARGRRMCYDLEFGRWAKAYRRRRLFWASEVTSIKQQRIIGTIFIPDDNISVEEVYIDLRPE